jgi:hypothetical protein
MNKALSGKRGTEVVRLVVRKSTRVNYLDRISRGDLLIG